MKPDIFKIVNTATIFTVFFCVVSALIFPCGYLIISYQNLISILDTEAEINSKLVSTIISTNPELWRYETVRIEELLARRPRSGIAETRRVFDERNNLIAENLNTIDWPNITATKNLIESANVVGRIEISRSMHTILLITGILMIFGLCFGLILYRLLPFNAVIQAMNEAQNANNDLIKIMEELKKKNADIEQFLYTASHDLRTPLVTVKNFLGFLENDISKGDQRIVLEDLQYLHGAADKMKQILDELLEISRIEHAGAPMVKLSFLELLTDVLNVMRGTILEWEVNIIMPQSDLMLIGDRSHLFRIWQNLIENAIKYCREDCNILIELGVWHHSNETVFFVKDNGIGIDHQYQNKIFGIFEQLNQNSPGTGMGLYMIQRIVNNYNGRIWVESEGIGKGSCFFFTLPKVIFQT